MPKTKTPKPAARVYRAASYARLSVDDESYGTSGSVLNQHAMIRDFADANGGLSIVAEYSDDGFSGSTFENRPGWGSLLADVEAGKIDCIVVKDLSRLGRNYLDVSRYLDQVFPALGVRVVAITDGYDSVAEKTPAEALMLPVKNLFNDMYCRDASAKTKASLSAKRRRGEFVGAFAPYGYAKGSGPDRGRLVIDPEPAGVVRGIFDARIGGMSAAGIAAMLNENLVPSPYEYFAAKGAARSSNFCKGGEDRLGCAHGTAHPLERDLCGHARAGQDLQARFPAQGGAFRRRVRVGPFARRARGDSGPGHLRPGAQAGVPRHAPVARRQAVAAAVGVPFLRGLRRDDGAACEPRLRRQALLLLLRDP